MKLHSDAGYVLQRRVHTVLRAKNEHLFNCRITAFWRVRAEMDEGFRVCLSGGSKTSYPCLTRARSAPQSARRVFFTSSTSVRACHTYRFTPVSASQTQSGASALHRPVHLTRRLPCLQRSVDSDAGERAQRHIGAKCLLRTVGY